MLLVMAAIVASFLHLQADSTAGIHGAVISSFNGRPIARVMIAVPDARKVTVTDDHGRFALSGLPPGRRAIQISYDGRVTEDYVFQLEPRQTKRISVLLDEDVFDLDPLVVEARPANLWRDLAGFYERRQTYRGFAHFFTREEITRMRPTRLSGLLTVEGIVTRCSQDCRPTRFSRAKICAVPVSVDGVTFREVDYDQIAVSDVAGVEVYRGVPPADLSHSLMPAAGSSIWMGTGLSAAGSCGLVEIWTR
jgi:carboxypeptidase family protein